MNGGWRSPVYLVHRFEISRTCVPGTQIHFEFSRQFSTFFYKDKIKPYYLLLKN